MTQFVETGDAATIARFFAALGIELTVQTRIAARDKENDAATPARMDALNEMQHACFGQVNAYLHNVADLFPGEASVSILYHYAEAADMKATLESALARARKLATQGFAPDHDPATTF